MNRKTILLFLALFPISLIINAKGCIVFDSLHFISANENQSETFDSMVDSLVTFAPRNLEVAMSFGEKAITLAYEISDSSKISLAHRMMGQLHNWRGESLEAERHLLIALSFHGRAQTSNGSSNQLLNIYNSLGVASLFQGKYGKAVEYYLAGLKNAIAEGDSSFIATIHINLGLVYYKIGDSNRAIRHYELGLPYMDNEGKANVLGNLALSFHAVGNFEESKIYLRQAEEKCLIGCHDKVLLNIQYGNGLIEYSGDDLDRSNASFKRALMIAQRLPDARWEAECLNYLARIQYRKGHSDSAQHLLNRAEQICISIRNPEVLTDAYETLAEINFNTGNYRAASDFLKKHQFIDDTLRNRQLQHRIDAAESEFMHQSNQAKIKIQNEILKLHNRLQEVQRLLISVFIFALLFLGVLLMNLWKGLENKRRTNKMLMKKVRERTIDLELKVAAAEVKDFEAERRVLSILEQAKANTIALRNTTYLMLGKIENSLVRSEYIREFKKISRKLDQDFERSV